jgi:hypothetical protein
MVPTPGATLDSPCVLFELFRDEIPRCASPRLRARGSIALLAGLWTAGGCVREPLPCQSALEEGDVVVTEIRGPQEGTRGEWFELYNTTSEALELRGLRGALQPLEGSAVDGEVQLTFLVRDSLVVEAGAYVVLGTLPLDASRRPEVDYSINADFRLEPTEVELSGGVVELPPDENADPKQLFTSARLRLYACDRLIDGFAYLALPELGTLAYDGAATPDADDNDDLSHWCADETEPPADGPQTATGYPGSAGEANRPCP